VNKDEAREKDEFEFYKIQIKEIEEAEKNLKIKADYYIED